MGVFLFTCIILQASYAQKDDSLIAQFVMPGLEKVRSQIESGNQNEVLETVQNLQKKLREESPEPAFLEGVLLKKLADALSENDSVLLSNQYFELAKTLLQKVITKLDGRMLSWDWSGYLAPSRNFSLASGEIYLR
ncbi:MAG: hypothetical protein R3B93_01565 [Bacteroidia bacterium]